MSEESVENEEMDQGFYDALDREKKHEARKGPCADAGWTFEDRLKEVEKRAVKVDEMMARIKALELEAAVPTAARQSERIDVLYKKVRDLGETVPPPRYFYRLSDRLDALRERVEEIEDE